MNIKEARIMLDPASKLAEANQNFLGGVGSITEYDDEKFGEFGLLYRDILVRVRFIKSYQGADGNCFPAIAVHTGDKITPDNGLVINLATIKDEALEPAFVYAIKKATKFANPGLSPEMVAKIFFPNAY